MSARSGGKRDQIAQPIDARACELVDALKRSAVIERVDERIGDVADPHRLKACIGTAYR